MPGQPHWPQPQGLGLSSPHCSLMTSHSLPWPPWARTWPCSQAGDREAQPQQRPAVPTLGLLFAPDLPSERQRALPHGPWGQFFAGCLPGPGHPEEHGG